MDRSVIKYKLFPNINFFQFIKKVHIQYCPSRRKTDLAKQMIVQMTSKGVQTKYPKFEVTYEIMEYDTPAVMTVTNFQGKIRKLNIEDWSSQQKKDIVNQWKFTCNMERLPENIS
eukprot:GHVL01019550.1.p1 GENE.GHVL01019550.1~~GHVL01019550.1.p1  ORF type:complete len:124 (+),score=17.40 GHVL01019550.1:30-374(+)